MSNVAKLGPVKIRLKELMYRTKHRRKVLTFARNEITAVSAILDQFVVSGDWVTGNEIAAWMNQSRVTSRKWDRETVSGAINALSAIVEHAGITRVMVVHSSKGYRITDDKKLINESNVLSSKNAQTRVRTTGTFFRSTVGMTMAEIQQEVESGIYELMLVKVDDNG